MPLGNAIEREGGLPTALHKATVGRKESINAFP